jgi:CopG family nickel-responsive transcriptional regulator
MGKSVKRFGVSLEKELLIALDNFVKKHRFPNRSQAIRFLIRKNLVEEAIKENREVVACIILIYDHHKRELINRSINLQHHFQNLIISGQHIHLDEHNCLEVIALKGKANKLQELANRLISLKGVKYGKLVSGINI